ncbi:hypothetical protein N7471_003254 [Penicillium samsonianum]|uniref:uncharacterized protein n=1 Tax=Penicillium samsonianum TaxID=1882272 RepID=UPI002547ED81|nr:uncharacterized protein N7471_003254 [Penicillium samsonianum]KAJ6143801.1 hypothetical protein N7471_003254 [Penicillium samsonianum]
MPNNSLRDALSLFMRGRGRMDSPPTNMGTYISLVFVSVFVTDIIMSIILQDAQCQHARQRTQNSAWWG